MFTLRLYGYLRIYVVLLTIFLYYSYIITLRLAKFKKGMVMLAKVIFSVGLGLELFQSANASLDLSSWSTQTVKTGQPWATIETKISSVNLDVKINQGVITTKATIEYVPGKGQLQNGICAFPVGCDPKVNPNCVSSCQKPNPSEIKMDSLETSTGFQVTDNTAITDMFLWVGDVKVRAELQNRALASAQYEDIVKRRRDPALIETWGNGSYSLRIFPNKSNMMRKVEITFVQGMENHGKLFEAILPVMSSLSPIYSAQILDQSTWPSKTIGSVTFKAVSTDGKAYNLNWGGLGNGTISATPLLLTASNVKELKDGIVSEASLTCSGCLDPWVSGTSPFYFGVKAVLDYKQLHFEAEPVERIVLLDINSKDSLAPDRARKLALLALKAYLKSPFLGNLGFSDGKGTITYVFPKSVAMNVENLSLAYHSLKAWKPNDQSDSKSTLNAFARGRGKGNARCVAILMNDEEYPVFEDLQKKISDELAATLNDANTMLFGFWNNYQITNTATATGGYQLGGISGWIHHPYAYRGVMDEAVLGMPTNSVNSIRPVPNQDWVMPPLFGLQRYDSYGIQNLIVKTSGVQINHTVFLNEMAKNGFYRGGELMMMMKSAVKSSLYPYYGYNPDSTVVRVSGQYQSGGTASILMSGLWGGLRFSQEYSVSLPNSTGAGTDGAAIWAIQQSEAWGRDYSVDRLGDIQKLGRDFHIVNQQMSLLALEPGAQLWTDMPSKLGTTGSTERLSIGAPVSDQKILTTFMAQGDNLDAASLEDILNSTILAVEKPGPNKFNHGTLSLEESSGSIHISWALTSGETQAHFQIMDISGKRIVELTATRQGQTYNTEWKPMARVGSYYLIAKSGHTKLVKKIEVNSRRGF